jgi:hypothetical protein
VIDSRLVTHCSDLLHLRFHLLFPHVQGFYNLYTNYPSQYAFVGNYREGGENFAVTKGLMNEMITAANTPPGSELYNHIHYDTLPLPLSSVPLFDFHFNVIEEADSLKLRLGVWGREANIPQCATITDYMKELKVEAALIKAKALAVKLAAEKRAKMLLAVHTAPAPLTPRSAPAKPAAASVQASVPTPVSKVAVKTTVVAAPATKVVTPPAVKTAAIAAKSPATPAAAAQKAAPPPSAKSTAKVSTPPAVKSAVKTA